MFLLAWKLLKNDAYSNDLHNLSSLKQLWLQPDQIKPDSRECKCFEPFHF